MLNWSCSKLSKTAPSLSSQFKDESTNCGWNLPKWAIFPRLIHLVGECEGAFVGASEDILLPDFEEGAAVGVELEATWALGRLQ